MLSVIAGYDELDPSSVEMPVSDYSSAPKVRVSKLRLGTPRRPFFDGVDAEIGKSVDAALEVLRKLTVTVSEVTLPAVDISMDEILRQSTQCRSLYVPFAMDLRVAGKYQPSTRERIQNGAKVKTKDYAQARRDIDLLRREIKKTFASVDLLITPTLPTPPVPISRGSEGSRTIHLFARNKRC